MPAGYDPTQSYNVVYLMHGGWSDQTTFLGTPEALVAFRDHRAFMGFSMGSVTTWRIFENCLAYFRYIAPASGNAGSGAYWADAVRRQGFGAEDFFIIGATGTDDFSGSTFAAQMQDMAANPLFHEGDGEPETNLIFRVGEGERHDGQAANRYMYNALAFLWRSGSTTE